MVGAASPGRSGEENETAKKPLIQSQALLALILKSGGNYREWKLCRQIMCEKQQRGTQMDPRWELKKKRQKPANLFTSEGTCLLLPIFFFLKPNS